MPCDTKFKARQTISERKAQVRSVVEKLSQGLATGRVKATVGPQGAIAFNLTDADRDGVTDACAYRMLRVYGGALAMAAIARAEQMAGRQVSQAAVAQGHHSHDGGLTWHGHKG